jgi:hypothetical protein
MTYQTWFADVLRAAGLTVVEQDDWKTRGKPWTGPVRGILWHHTAGPRRGNAPSLAVVMNGRADLPGPLSQFVLGRDGTWYVVAAGRSNHAGAGAWQGVTSGNSSFLGIEAENAGDGTDEWPPAQIDAYAKGSAALLEHLGLSSLMVAGHKEYALPKGRKIDPTLDMAAARQNVAFWMDSEPEDVGVRVVTLDPRRAMLRRGDHGASVIELQQKLGIKADGDFGPMTESAVKAFQSRKGLTVDGLVGPTTWKALG